MRRRLLQQLHTHQQNMNSTTNIATNSQLSLMPWKIRTTKISLKSFCTDVVLFFLLVQYWIDVYFSIRRFVLLVGYWFFFTVIFIRCCSGCYCTGREETRRLFSPCRQVNEGWAWCDLFVCVLLIFSLLLLLSLEVVVIETNKDCEEWASCK